MLGRIAGSILKSNIQLPVRTVDSFLQGFIFSGVVTAYKLDWIPFMSPLAGFHRFVFVSMKNLTLSSAVERVPRAHEVVGFESPRSVVSQAG
jgi:hypothetical protein